MTMTIELTPEQEARLRERARREGRDAEALAAALVCAGIDVSETAPPGYWDGFIGVVDSSEANGGVKAHLSESTGETFMEILLEKKREGHL